MQDGNHRVTAAVKAGQDRIRARIGRATDEDLQLRLPILKQAANAGLKGFVNIPVVESFNERKGVTDLANKEIMGGSVVDNLLSILNKNSKEADTDGE